MQRSATISIKDFTLDISELEFVFSGLSWPDSIIAEKDGTLWMSDNRVGPGVITPEAMYACAGPTLQFPASITFAGPDLRTAYLGSLAMPHLVKFQSPVPGLPMRHWR